MQAAFTPNIIPTKGAEPSKISKKWPGKKLSFFTLTEKLKENLRFSVNTIHISLNVLKISAVSLLLRTCEITDIFSFLSKYIWYSPQKSSILYLFNFLPSLQWSTSVFINSALSIYRITPNTVELLWLIYHIYFKLVLESLRKTPIAADIIIFGIIKDVFLFYMVCCLYLLESPCWGDSNENTQHTFS